MKGVIYYYSTTGNTRLACEYLAEKIDRSTFDLVNIINYTGTPDLNYDIVGFAATADFWGPPMLMQNFISHLPQQHGKPAFVFNTYGLFSGRTLSTLRDWVQAKGFKVIAGHSLRTPENYPPLRIIGITSNNAPKNKHIQKFNSFINELNNLLARNPAELKETSLNIGWINSMIPMRPRTTARADMGEKYVDSALCTECGLCKNKCPYGAIELKPKPVFDMDKCYGCWSCFNMCPTKAIYTKKIRGKGQYPKALEQLAEKLR